MCTARPHPAMLSLALGLGSLGIWIPAADADKPPPDLAVGAQAYQQHCARCHGAEGKGDGRDAKRLVPRPRDLTSGVYKFRSTASGTTPTDGDLFVTLTRGLSGSGMPDWAHLDERLRWQLVYYLKSLSSNFQDNPSQPVDLGRDPGRKHMTLAQGRQVYEKLGCAACHGAAGRADGMSAATLEDQWGFATRPADLTQGWNYRRGREPREIVERILAGLDGTPMPSYAEAATPEDVWQLAYYVQSLQEPSRWDMIVRATYLAGPLPESPEDPRWQQAAYTDLRLRPVVDGTGTVAMPPTVNAVRLQAFYNDDVVSARVTWRDPTDDRAEAPDALAMVLRPRRAPPQGVAEEVPRTQSEGRPADVPGDTVSLQTWPLREALPLDLCVWSAQREQAREAVAKDYEPLLGEAPAGLPIASRAAYADGQWSLVLSRFREPADIDDAAQLVSRAFHPVAFVVWDGGNPGQRAISPWIDLTFPPPMTEAAKTDHDLALVWGVAGVVLLVALGLGLRRP